ARRDRLGPVRAVGGSIGRRPGVARGSWHSGPRARRAGRHAAALPRPACRRAPAFRAGLERGDAGAARRRLSPVLHGRRGGRDPGAGGAGRVRVGAAGGSSVAPALPADRRAGRLDAADSAARATARWGVGARRSRLRGAATGAARARECARRRAPEGARGGAAAGIPRGGAPCGHEIKNPLTAMRIAVDQLQRDRTGLAAAVSDEMASGRGRTEMSVEVLSAETDRLERLAREFADFGRLPEGPQSEVDVVELLQELGRTAVPEGVQVSVEANGGRRTVQGYYDPLRRALSNLLRNAAEAMGGRGAIEVRVTGDGRGMAITIADHGPGIPQELQQRVFEPYFTTKRAGTGLGLALVRQTLEAHGGTITAGESLASGAARPT